MATAFAAVEIDLDRFIDLDRYPVHDVTDPTRRDLVAETRDQMGGKGCFRIPQFLRPEAVDAGCAILVGTDEEKIFTHAAKLLSDPAAYAAMAGKPNPFGDGKASQRIADILSFSSVIER